MVSTITITIIIIIVIVIVVAIILMCIDAKVNGCTSDSTLIVQCNRTRTRGSFQCAARVSSNGCLFILDHSHQTLHHSITPLMQTDPGGTLFREHVNRSLTLLLSKICPPYRDSRWSDAARWRVIVSFCCNSTNNADTKGAFG
jgi:hypothetical protein